MSLELRYLGVSEGFVKDGRSLTHLTGFDPAFFSFDSFPATWPLALIVLWEETDRDAARVPEGTPIQIRMSLIAPSNQTVAVADVPGVAERPPRDDIPFRSMAVYVAAITFPEPGDYQLEATLDAAGQHVEARRSLTIRGPIQA
ncbi:MAG TPA: hypothetical protein VK773_07580 [Acidimicrobiales bacterium]|jgi:hypothetical protein|nr:hypothetical protein [Acidimicrobiales bacterium]